MPFRDILKKKEKIHSDDSPQTTPEKGLQVSEFTFMRTDTNTQELIQPPVFAGDNEEPDRDANFSTSRRNFGFRRGSRASPARDGSPPQKEHKRLSERFLGHRKTASSSSVNVPSDLPDVPDAYSERGDEQEKEARWEERATILATSRPTTPQGPVASQIGSQSADRSITRPRSVSDADSDVNIQEAIRLHENGDLEAATKMFHTLAERGNVLSQVLYGLSLRHGWGCQPDLERAVHYLSNAASNSATVESEALKAGMKKGGAAKGELVLAIFELANCFRYGWGVQVDKIAARQYYETAANLGDTDAMNEAAWCYVEGYGGKKDKVSFTSLHLFSVLESGTIETGTKDVKNPSLSQDHIFSPITPLSKTRVSPGTFDMHFLQSRS